VRALILIGHAGHPEVEGTKGQFPGPVLLVQNVDEVAALTMPADTRWPTLPRPRSA